MNAAKQDLVHYLHDPISIPFNHTWKARMMDAAIGEICDAITNAKPPEMEATKLRSIARLTKWAASHHARLQAAAKHESMKRLSMRQRRHSLKKRASQGGLLGAAESASSRRHEDSAAFGSTKRLFAC